MKTPTNDNNNPVGYWLGRILAYLTVILSTLLITGGGIALLKLLIDFILN